MRLSAPYLFGWGWDHFFLVDFPFFPGDREVLVQHTVRPMSDFKLY